MKNSKVNYVQYGTGYLVDTFKSHKIQLDMKVESAAGMLSSAERKMLYYLAKTFYTGSGAIIDGGSFFGSSLVASAAGLKDNDQFQDFNFGMFPNKKPIFSYELGFLPAPKDPSIDRNRVFGGVKYTLGDDFVDVLLSTTADYHDIINFNIGDLVKETWHDLPIEICFIDVCKTIALNKHVSEQFYHKLIGGKSYLINQDFFFDRLPWIKVTMGYLEDYFEWHGQVATSSIYKNIKAVPLDVARFDPFTECTLDECLKFHDRSPYSHLDIRYTYFLELSKAYLMALKNAKKDALEYLENIETEFAEILDDKDADRGNFFRLQRARRQITNGNIFKVS